MSRDLPNSVCQKAAGWSGLAKYRLSDGQWFECTGDVDPQPPVPQRGTSGEQQMKSPVADKAYIPNPDTRVVACWGGFPRGRRNSNFKS